MARDYYDESKKKKQKNKLIWKKNNNNNNNNSNSKAGSNNRNQSYSSAKSAKAIGDAIKTTARDVKNTATTAVNRYQTTGGSSRNSTTSRGATSQTQTRNQASPANSIEENRIRREQESKTRREELLQRQKTRTATTQRNANTRNQSTRNNQAVRSGLSSHMQKQQDPIGIKNKSVQERLEDSRKAREEGKTSAVGRALKNTPELINKAVKDVGAGYSMTLHDIDEMNYSDKNWPKAKAHKLGVADDEEQIRGLEESRKETLKATRDEMKKISQKKDKRQADWEEKTKDAKGLEKAYYGAVESGTGMLTDLAIGAITRTGRMGSLASMAIRTYGTTRGSAEKEGARKKEDRLYSLFQAGKEAGTELMLPGAGLAKGYAKKGALSSGEKIAARTIKNLDGPLANLASSGIKLLGGVVEENVEEGVAWGLDPIIKEHTYGKKVRERKKEALRAESAALKSNIRNEEDARAASAYLGSNSFIEDNIKAYMESGLSKEDSRKLAETMRDYLTASLTGDTDTMEAIEDTIAGKKLSKEDWDFGELADTVASTTLLTATTGIPGTIKSAAIGQKFINENGTSGVRALANTAIDFEDPTMSIKAQAMRDRIDSGKAITATQATDLMQGIQEQVYKDNSRQAASYAASEKVVKKEGLAMPYVADENGRVRAMDETTIEAYESTANQAKEIISILSKTDGKSSLTAKEIDTGSRAIAGFKTGVFTVNDANTLNYSNTTVRSAFHEATGINLDQYVVKDKGGNVNISATNAATKDALFAMASENLIKTARVATDNWMNVAKGEVVSQVSARMGAKGSLALQEALDDVDERDRSTYMMNANAADMLYQVARNMGTNWESAKVDAKNLFPQISESKLQSIYEAGLQDKAIAEDKMHGMKVSIGEAMQMKEVENKPTGQVFIDTAESPKGTIIRTFSEIAKNLGVDIHLVDAIRDKDGRAVDRSNGSYINGAIYLNVNTAIEKNVGYIFMHEVTHHLKMYAPEQFNELENLVREKWFGYNPEQMQDEIAKKIESYAKAGQTISAEDALEEIIADAAHEFINDPNFAEKISDENPTVAKAILNSIRNALRALRNMLSSEGITDETHMNSLFSQLGIFDEAERLWLNAYTQAVKNKAAVGLIQWDDRARERYTIHTLDDGSRYVKLDGNLFLDEDGSEMTPREAFNSLVGKEVTLSDGDTVTFIKRLPNKFDGYNELFRRRPKYSGDINIKELNEAINKNIEEALTVSKNINPDVPDKNNRHAKYGIKSFDTREVSIADDNAAYRLELTIAIMNDDTKFAYAKRFLETDDNLFNEIKKTETASQSRLNQPSNMDNIPSSDTESKFSITPEQDAEYMQAVESGDMEAAQRMVDEAAKDEGFDYRLFHGTAADFTVFDRSKGGKSNAMAKLGHWFTGSQEGAQAWTNSIWWGDSEAHVYDTYIKLKNPKIYETPIETKESRKKLENISKGITEQEQIMRDLNKKYENFWYTKDQSHLRIAFNNSALSYKATRESAINSLDKMQKGEDEWAGVNISRDEYSELANDVNAYFDAKEKLEELNVQHGELFYNDAYEQLQTDLYKLAGMTAEDANFGGIGKDMRAYANKDKAEIVEELRQKLIDEGYDGIIIKNTRYDSGTFGGINTQYVVFAPENIKLADPVTYDDNGNVIPLSQRFDTGNKDIRYSVTETDSEGNVLSDGQVDYFKNSKARDEDGRLIVFYHGTPNFGFEIFKVGSYFTPNRKYAGRFMNPNASSISYGKEETQRGIYAVYLNAEKPFDTRDPEARRIFEEEYFGKWGMGTPLMESGLPDWLDAEDLQEFLQESGYDYDCVIVDEGGDGGYGEEVSKRGFAYIPFDKENQVKDIDNLNPTDNPNIKLSITPEDEVLSSIAYEDAEDNYFEALARYEELISQKDFDPENYNVKVFSEDEVSDFYAALNADEAVVYADIVAEEDRVRMARSKEDFYSNLNAKWQDRWHTDGEVLDVKSVKTDIRNLVMGVMNNSDTDHKYKTGLVNKTLMDVRTAYQLMKQDRQEAAASLLYHSAYRMISNADFYIDDTFGQYKELKDYFRTTKISLGEEYWSDVDFGALRKANFGRMKLVKGSTNVDKIYMELAEMFPEWFDTEEILSVPDMLEQMSHVLDAVQPYKEAYSSEAAAELAFDIADELYDIMAGGKEVRSLADQYRERYDAKTKAMKQRHAEAIRGYKEKITEGIQAERAKWHVREEARRERTNHAKAFGDIQSNYKWLTDRLLTNTADKNIPEQYKKELAKLLSAFDLQTVGSKKRESKTGHKAQKTLQMSALRTGLQKLHEGFDSFYVHDAITDLIDDLAKSVDGKTIDELNLIELGKIDNLLKALKHEFINYDKVRIADKKAEVSGLGRSQVDSALSHASYFGAGRDYQNVPGWIDKIINLDEVTPAYLFRRIDPNETGIGLMWKEVRRSFDKYVRNTAQLNEWMEDIVGEYHQKGILWNKYGAGELSQWRSENYAETIGLENGTISLTPAQMMSVYCLSKRTQAYKHMVGAGVVVAPVSFQSKLMSDIKKKANATLPIKLTDADIKTIVAQLTPEQIRVADKIQELMATKMADWGNEASMDVMGIKLFNEADYFPIRSDKAALARDLNDNDFVEAIRNFGFTKAVQPGARNAIMVEDIFDVVTEHCNNMNLYNSYSASINDFMKVYNYRDFRKDGSEYTVQQAIAHAYSRKATTFIMSFMKDLNGNVSGRASGIEDALNGMLANAKKASVFANFRVAAQQPTAITRAFAEISPKYLKGIKIEKGAMKEMFEHCPIALWKSWGYYDINMGRSIEDVIMNNGNWLEDKATDMYGVLDNVTWTAIWQMVKAEMKDTNPSVEIGSDQYWKLCNERMSEIVDLTQVVDSPMHRSHAMRDKGFMKKMFTSFMAEPTLTFNMIKDGYVRAAEAYKSGNKAEATKTLSKTVSVAVLQAATVASFAAVVDALRGKKPDKDDDDDGILHLWWVNTLENFKDEMKIWNKVYFIKDIASIFEGWENRNLALQGVQQLSLGFRQLQGDSYARSSKPWYENMLGGLGYMTGVPLKTMMTGMQNAMRLLGVKSQALSSLGEGLENMALDSNKESIDNSGFFGKLLNIGAKTDDENINYENVPTKDELPDNLTDEQKEEIIKQARKRAEKENAEPMSEEDLLYKVYKATAGMEDGAEKNKKIYSIASDGLKGSIQNGDYGEVEKRRNVVRQAGGDLEYFDSRVFEVSKTAFKKSIKFDATNKELDQQQRIYDYLISHGMTEEQISADIVYKSDAAKDMKVAFRTGDKETMLEALVPLAQAGLTYEDLEKLWKNRNRMDLSKYEGRYKDKLKSTGKYIWPADGVITSEFGYRNAPTAGASTNHPAIDIGAPAGSPVVAADGGQVIFAGWSGGYGKQVAIRHDDGTVTYYSHLSWWDAKEGDVVAQGQEIGKVGSTGNSTGPHLDFKVEVNGQPVNPLKYLNDVGKQYDLSA